MNMKTFVIDQKLNYQEHLSQDIYVNKYYQMERSNVTMKFNTIPDACVDIQFTTVNGKAVVYGCGSFLQSDVSPSSSYTWCFGVKFNPGMYPALVRGNMDELIEGRKVLVGCPWLDEIAKAVCAASTFQERVKIFEEKFPFQEQFSGMNTIVEKIIEQIEKAHGCISIADMAEDFQYNQKYLVRVFRKATGLSMKKYATIIQIQTAIRYLQEGRADEVYEKLGYYDQSYFIKKFKQYTSMTPREFLKKVGRNIV